MRLQIQLLVPLVSALVSPVMAAEDPAVVQHATLLHQPQVVQSPVQAAREVGKVVGWVDRLALQFDLSAAYLTVPRVDKIDGFDVDAPSSRSELMLHVMPSPWYWYSLGVANALKQGSAYSVLHEDGSVTSSQQLCFGTRSICWQACKTLRTANCVPI